MFCLSCGSRLYTEPISNTNIQQSTTQNVGLPHTKNPTFQVKIALTLKTVYTVAIILMGVGLFILYIGYRGMCYSDIVAAYIGMLGNILFFIGFGLAIHGYVKKKIEEIQFKHNR